MSRHPELMVTNHVDACSAFKRDICRYGVVRWLTATGVAPTILAARMMVHPRTCLTLGHHARRWSRGPTPHRAERGWPRDHARTQGPTPRRACPSIDVRRGNAKRVNATTEAHTDTIADKLQQLDPHIDHASTSALEGCDHAWVGH